MCGGTDDVSVDGCSFAHAYVEAFWWTYSRSYSCPHHQPNYVPEQVSHRLPEQVPHRLSNAVPVTQPYKKSNFWAQFQPFSVSNQGTYQPSSDEEPSFAPSDH